MTGPGEELVDLVERRLEVIANALAEEDDQVVIDEVHELVVELLRVIRDHNRREL